MSLDPRSNQRCPVKEEMVATLFGNLFRIRVISTGRKMKVAFGGAVGRIVHFLLKVGFLWCA